MSRTLVMGSLLLALAAGALAVWTFVEVDNETVPAEQDTSLTAAANAFSRRDSDPVAVEADGAGLLRAEVEAGSHFPIPADAEWVPVRVIDSRTGAPVEGVEVVWLFTKAGVVPWEMLRRLPPDEAERLQFDLEAAARDYGSSARSDANGLVQVAVRPNGVTLYARAAGRYGRTSVDLVGTPPPGGHRLLLLPERELRVAVFDAEGKPAIGVPVRMVRDGDPERKDGAPVRYECARTTAPDGIARLMHLQDRFSAPRTQSTKSWRVRVELPYLNEVSAPFDPDALPAEPVELHLPPTGQVLARTTFEGRRADHRDTVLLFPNEPQALESEQRAAWRTSELDGWVCFRHVPLGKRFVARASLAGWIERDLDGPTSAGETIRVEIARPPRDPKITGRLVDESGSPMRDVEGYTRVEWRLLGGGGSGGSELQSDSDGRFRYGCASASGAEVEYHRLDFFVDRLNAAPLRARLGPRTLSNGTTELGDVVMTPAPVLVAGCLQFPPGVRPFQVGFEVQHEGPSKWIQGQTGWHRLEGGDVDVRQEDDGRFVVNGDPLPGPWRLQVHSAGKVVCHDVPFEPGQQDLVVPVEIAERLWATLYLPTDLPDGMRGLLRPESTMMQPWDRRTSNLGWLRPHDGLRHAMIWQGLEAGRHTFEVRLDGFAAPLLSIADVVIPAPSGGDPRLLDFDLRPLLQSVTVHVLGAEPNQLAELRAWPRPRYRGPEGSFEGFRAMDGLVRFPAPAKPIDLLLLCKGFQSVLLRDVQSEATVTLQPWPEVQVSLPDMPSLPSGIWLLARLRPGPGGPRDADLQPQESRSVVDGHVALPFGPGDQVLSLTLVRGDDQREFSLPLPTPVPMRDALLEIQDSGPTIQRELEALQKVPPRRETR